jgi:hypothetical protein
VKHALHMVVSGLMSIKKSKTRVSQFYHMLQARPHRYSDAWWQIPVQLLETLGGDYIQNRCVHATFLHVIDTTLFCCVGYPWATDMPYL